ncbi:hypothetical protein ACTXT7_005526 [Hymenolepis weldensis]
MDSFPIANERNIQPHLFSLTKNRVLANALRIETQTSIIRFFSLQFVGTGYPDTATIGIIKNLHSLTFFSLCYISSYPVTTSDPPILARNK